MSPSSSPSSSSTPSATGPAARSGVIVPARRTEEIRYAVRDIVLLAEQAARAGKEMLYLNVGDPNIFDFAPAAHVIEATIEAMRANRNGYAPSSGIPRALEAVNRRAAQQGIGNICHTYITSGASEAIDLALSALVNVGENVLTPAPVYPFYTAAIAKLSIENRFYYLDEGNGWQPDVDDIRARIDDKTRAIVLINPGNPTGTAISEDVLRGVIDLAIEHNLVIFSDEIYDRLLFDGAAHTSTAALSSEAKVITFNGMSKAYVVPGFRLGWGIVSGPIDELEQYCEAIRKMERARLSANHPEQYAIAPAIEQSEAHIAEMVSRLQRRRDITCERLNAMPGISCVKPAGAFYAYPRIELNISDDEFVHHVVRETGVVIVPGSGFGQRPGTNHFRVVFLPPEDVLHKAYDRIEQIARLYAG